MLLQDLLTEHTQHANAILLQDLRQVNRAHETIAGNSMVPLWQLAGYCFCRSLQAASNGYHRWFLQDNKVANFQLN